MNRSGRHLPLDGGIKFCPMLTSEQIVGDRLGGKPEVASQTVKPNAKMISKKQASHTEGVKPNTGLHSIMV